MNVLRWDEIVVELVEVLCMRYNQSTWKELLEVPVAQVSSQRGLARAALAEIDNG